MSRAKSDNVIRSRTSANAWSIIVSVTIYAAFKSSEHPPHSHAHVATVHQAHVVEVIAAAVTGGSDREHRLRCTSVLRHSLRLSISRCQSRRRCTRSGPRAGRCGELNRWIRRQGKTTVAGKCPGPSCVAAMVFEGKHCCRCYVTCKCV